MNKKQKKMLARILVSAALMIGLHFLPVDGYIRFFLYLIPYLIIGYDILIKAFKGIKNRQPFDESLLMAVATIGAIAIALCGDGDYTERSRLCCSTRSESGSRATQSERAGEISAI